MTMMRQLTTRQEIDGVLAHEAPAVIYKHSTRCPVSLDAYNEMQRFVVAHPDVPVYLVDVVRDRPLSQYVAERTRTVHQSPQAIVLLAGAPAWCGSHYSVTSHELAAQLAALEGR
ncbi:MAG TPA: bacillithiol system redox-active protein YtxJ [Gemmatimonadales bacterium]|nr:bacillithiol system redox-active protein YtxJ [Gemmatimonadales bacterium]